MTNMEIIAKAYGAIENKITAQKENINIIESIASNSIENDDTKYAIGYMSKRLEELSNEILNELKNSFEALKNNEEN